MTRPDPPTYGYAGHRWEVRPDELGWTTDAAVVAGRRCRFGSRWRGYCGRPAVAALDRARAGLGRRLWYGYCGDHLYGRWIENDVVVSWRLVPERSR